MKQESKICKPRPVNFLRYSLILLFVFLLLPASLFSASITNEGRTIVKVNARSSQGIVGGGSIKPGQNLHLKNDVLWIEEVPEGGASQVQLKIIENDGRIGYINTSGGRYTFQLAAKSQPIALKEKKTQVALTEGYSENRSNLAMLLSLIDKGNKQSYSLLLPGQKGAIPKDTVEVIADRHGWSSGDVKIALFLVMPDGKEHMIQTSHAVVRIDENTN